LPPATSHSARVFEFLVGRGIVKRSRIRVLNVRRRVRPVWFRVALMPLKGLLRRFVVRGGIIEKVRHCARPWAFVGVRLVGKKFLEADKVQGKR